MPYALGYVAFACAVTGLGALFNGGLRGNRGDKLVGLGLLLAAGGFAELTNHLAS